METPKIKISLFLPEPYPRLLAVEAAKAGCSRSDLVCRMLEEREDGYVKIEEVKDV